MALSFSQDRDPDLDRLLWLLVSAITFQIVTTDLSLSDH